MKKLRPILLLSLLVIGCKQPTKKVVAAPATNPQLDSLTAKLDSIYSHGSIIGFATAVVGLDSVYYRRGFGHANLAENRKYTPQTLMNIGSVSKTFIGISLLKGQELGILNLDDPVNNYLSFPVSNKNFPNTPITLRQLATHTSSILDSDYYAYSYVLLTDSLALNERNMGYFQPSETKTSMEVYLEKLLSAEGKWNEGSYAAYEPGSFYEYSNIAATLAAVALEKAAGMSFAEFTQKHILDPLEMNSSGWSHSVVDDSKRTRSYINRDTLIAKYELITYPDGGMISSASDLSIYLMELMKGKAGKGTLLSGASYETLFTKQLISKQLPEGGQDENSGVFMDFSNRGLGHSGGDPGIATFMYFNPETNIGKIVFQNTDFDEDPSVIETFKKIWAALGQFETKIP